MSNNFETCNMWGSNNLIQICENCRIKCCGKCFEHHGGNACKYIKDSKCHICEIHRELLNSLTGYCFQCQYLICDLCRTIGDHDDHTIVVLTEAVFIVQSEHIHYTESDEKRSIETTSDTKKLLETLTDQIENQCKKIIDCISLKKHRLLSELNEHKQSLKDYEIERERDIQSVREVMSELKSSRAVFPIIFLHKWQNFAKQMNKLEKIKPADRLTFHCGLINKSNLDEQFGKLQNVDPQKDVNDQEVDKLVSDESLKINNTDMVSRQYQEIQTQNESLKREALSLKSELETLKNERNYMIQLSEETCQFVKDYNSKLEDCCIHVNEKNLLKRFGSSHMDSYADRMNYIIKQFQMLKEHGIQNEKGFLEQLKGMAKLTNELNSDINQKQHEIRKMNKLLNDLQSKERRISELGVKESDARKGEQKLYDTKDKLQIEHSKEIESLKIKHQSDLLKQVQNEKNRNEKVNRQTQEKIIKLLKEKDENILQLRGEIKGSQARFDDNINHLQLKLYEGETEIMQLRQVQKETQENIKKLITEKDELQTRLSSVAGEKLSKGNPTITDLGDPNRPMKIGEKYGELYDNEWTDAMECINDIKSFYSDCEHLDIEEVMVLHLCRLLKMCYNECLSLADEQIDKIGKTISETLCLNVNSRSDYYNLPACKDVVVQRRQKSDHFVNHLLANQIIGKTAVHDWNYAYKSGDVMKRLMKMQFFEKCVSLCWCMVIQDPVMYLDADITQGTTFDKNTYKEFVKSGNKVKYIVWPALFLHKDGPLLHKGIVQAYWQ
ncbi:polyamine-modulated factor 1-binding protein 1-like [Mytilus californianus]|uniref:polyamine-modulated factor 1-binding protein 1-like n=1 Tax=Mytilus californianus TaxID=6549 RepID=UPI002246643B|nr:polyamine-modulated factor 1-binding protein 1-like [Mytilus californianus]